MKKMIKFANGFAAMLLAMVLFIGCAQDISSDVYSTESFGEVAETYKGVVISTRAVTVRPNETSGGTAVGAVSGGVIGSSVGKGSGSAAAAVGGALIGGFLGHHAQKKIYSQGGMEYVIELESGELKTVVQEVNSSINVGQKVLLMISKKGRSRIVSM